MISWVSGGIWARWSSVIFGLALERSLAGEDDTRWPGTSLSYSPYSPYTTQGIATDGELGAFAKSLRTGSRMVVLIKYQDV
jgi:hypothetical protein